MADISKADLLVFARGQAPTLFADTNPEMDEARANNLDIVARGFLAMGKTVEGYEQTGV